jgi:chromosome segregation ATPase
LTSTLSEREQQLKADFERERSRLTEQHQDALQTSQESHQADLTRRIDELTSTHHAELSAMQKRHAAALRDHSEDRGTEMVTLHRQLGEKEEEKHDVERQLAKSEAIREVLKQDTENMRIERQQLREKVHILELEIIEHGKAKFDARLMAEKDRLEQSYKSSFEEVNQEISTKIEENKHLSQKLASGEMEIAAIRANMRSAQEERDRIEASLKNALTEKETAHAAELKRALTRQEAELQASYLKLIQQQVDSLVGLIQNQTSEYSNFGMTFTPTSCFLLLNEVCSQLFFSGLFYFSDRFTRALPHADQTDPSVLAPGPSRSVHL